MKNRNPHRELAVDLMVASTSNEIIEQVRLHNDIVELIGRYVPLKKSGARYRALCPFHKEKTPSFHVDPQKQLYYCFGCHAGGDAFKFVMEYEKVDFNAALRMLAERSGINVEGMGRSPSGGADREKLYRLHESLSMFYHRILLESKLAGHAREYLRERGLEKSAGDYLLGYAPDKPGTLIQWAEKNDFEVRDLEAAGVLVRSERDKGHYERFRNRLMFPVRNVMGKVVGFSGRLLGEGSGGKYVNSPETLLFKKSHILYALDTARKSIIDTYTAIVCEGQIDVIRCHQAGFHNAVAPQGTAVTEDHGNLLKRYADEAILVFDSDKAGQNAALHAAEICVAAGLSVRIAALPEGEDPDSLIRSKGGEAFKDLVDSAQSLIEFHVGILSKTEDLNSETGRKRAAEAILETIRHAPGAIDRDEYIRQASAGLGIREKALRQDLQKKLRPGRRKNDQDFRPAQPPAHPPHEVALIELLTAHPELMNFIAEYLPLRVITDPDCRTIIDCIWKLPEDESFNLLTELRDASAECRRLAAQIQMQARTITDQDISPEKAAKELILALRQKDLERQRDACKRRIKEAGSSEERRALLAESASLTLLIKKLGSGWENALPSLELRDKMA